MYLQFAKIACISILVRLYKNIYTYTYIYIHTWVYLKMEVSQKCRETYDKQCDLGVPCFQTNRLHIHLYMFILKFIEHRAM